MQAFTAMLTVTGLDHRVIGLVVAEHPLHHGNRRQVTLEVALHRLGAKTRGQADDFSTRRRHAARLAGNGFGDRDGGVDVDYQYSHDSVPCA
ncbi:hypothetical protein D3C79_969920 [compost metagenome]